MATNAALLLMAIHAREAEKMYVLLMVKGHHGSAIVTGSVYPFVWLLDVWMEQAHDVGGIRYFRQLHLSRLSGMTHRALGVMTPFPVTAHALAVVSTLQAGLI
jgi:hypothetical protein